MLIALGLTGLNAQAQRVNRVTDRQVTGILQRLERSTNRFRTALNTALISTQIDQTRPQNDINSFEPAFEAAVDQFQGPVHSAGRGRVRCSEHPAKGAAR
jgi:hypothetical protein